MYKSITFLIPHIDRLKTVMFNLTKLKEPFIEQLAAAGRKMPRHYVTGQSVYYSDPIFWA